MQCENLMRLVLVSIAYLILVFGLGTVMLKPIAGKRSIFDKLLIYFISGNFYIMNIIYFLLFIHCTNRVITILFLLLGAVGIRYLCDRKGFVDSAVSRAERFALLAKGAYGWRLFRKEKTALVMKTIKSFRRSIFQKHLLETLGYLFCFSIQAYYIGYRYIRYSTFGAPDEATHLEWIQQMLKGNLFYHGVYPFGYHNIVYAIAKVFDQPAYTTLRYFGFIGVMCMLFMLILLLNKVYRSRYIPILCIFLYVAADIFDDSAWDRLQYIIPEEFGILFLFPMLIFLYQYVCKKQKADLVLFGISYSLTLYVHFYVTIIALIVCLCIGVSAIYRIIRQKILLRLILCGMISTMIAILPFGIGLLTGHEPEGSLYWAVGVMQGNDQNHNDQMTTGSETANATSDIADKLVIPKGASLETKLVTTSEFIKEHTISSLVNAELIFYLMILSMLLIIIRGFLHLILRSKRDQMFLQLSIALYIVFLIILYNCKQLGLPVIIQDYRVSVFLGYAAPLLFGIPLELLYLMLEKWKWPRRIINLSIIILIGFIAFYIYDYGYTREFGRFTLEHSDSSIETCYKIMKENKDYSWTIVSAGEYSTVLDKGYHFEWISLLYNMENFNNGKKIEIPSQKVFFIIEKRPIQKDTFIRIEKGIQKFPLITTEDAEPEITAQDVENSTSYYKDNRRTIMAKAYYWAKRYQFYFPNEMSVYYEDDNVICYELKQDVNYLNNLAIDYGFNKY